MDMPDGCLSLLSLVSFQVRRPAEAVGAGVAAGQSREHDGLGCVARVRGTRRFSNVRRPPELGMLSGKHVPFAQGVDYPSDSAPSAESHESCIEAIRFIAPHRTNLGVYLVSKLHEEQKGWTADGTSNRHTECPDISDARSNHRHACIKASTAAHTPVLPSRSTPSKTPLPSEPPASGMCRS